MTQLLNDEPTLLDTLGRAKLVQEVGDAIARCQPPQVLGIHGDWGVGKTSVLHQLHLYLAGECPQQGTEPPAEGAKHKLGREGIACGRHAGKVTVIWFEAWRYQSEQAPIVALLQEIRTQLPWAAKALQETKKLGEVAIRSALLALEDLTKRIGIQASKIQQAGERWEAENLATRLPSHKIREHLDGAIKKLLGGRKGQERRLVVLVDDLDRCSSETAYQLLEGIKIYLNVPSCVFVLAMNQAIIEDAIAKQLSLPRDDEGERRNRAKEYVEKLCQNIWHLSLVDDPAELLRNYLRAPDQTALAPEWESLCRVIEHYRCLPPIPRKIKSYANLLLRVQPHVRSLKDATGDPQETFGKKGFERWAGLVVLFTCLYLFHPRLYRLLRWNRLELFKQLREWCLGRSIVASGTPFKHLRLAFDPADLESAQADADQRSPVPLDTQPADSSLHDPTSLDVLWVQRLVLDLNPVSESEIESHLLP